MKKNNRDNLENMEENLPKSTQISEISENVESGLADVEDINDPDFPVVSVEELVEPETTEWHRDEPVPMQMATHEIADISSEEDPDAPVFIEHSTRPADATPVGKGLKLNRKPKTILVVTLIAVLIVLILSVISLGNLNERMASPLTVGNHDVSNAEFSFMYHYVLLENGVDIFKENTATMLASPGENGFDTYRDYFLDVTAKEIQTTYMLYDDAVAHGYSISDNHKKRAEAYIDWLKTKADAIDVDLNTYIKGTFGPYVDKSLIMEVLPKVYFTEEYAANQKLNELKATQEQAEQAYQESRNSYDLVSFRAIRITFEAREESYVKTANITAQKIVDEVANDQAVFQTVAAKYFSGEMQQKLLIPDSTLHKDVRYSELDANEWRTWLFDFERKSGDCVIFQDEYGFPIIFCFVDRVRQEEPLRNVRFFTINMEDTENDIPGVPASDIIPVSQSIYDSITDEASMVTLETTYADQLLDGSMHVEQKTSIYPGNHSEEIDAWIFDSSRQSGDKTMYDFDNKIVILFYVQASPNPEWYDRVNSFIRMDNYHAFVSEALKDYEYTFHKDGLEYIQDIPS